MRLVIQGNLENELQAFPGPQPMKSFNLKPAAAGTIRLTLNNLGAFSRTTELSAHAVDASYFDS
jgi:hypothetical protein